MGFLSVFKKIGKAITKVATHPAMAVITATFPIPWLKAGLVIVRGVNEIVKKVRAETGHEMSDEEKRLMFGQKFSKIPVTPKFPAASNGDLVTLAGILVKLEKQGLKDEDLPVDEKETSDGL